LFAQDDCTQTYEHDRLRKPSTISAYRSLLRSQLLPTFAELPIESITPPMIESWIGSTDRTAATRVKGLAMMHGSFKRARKVWGLTVNPAVDVERPPLASSGDIERLPGSSWNFGGDPHGLMVRR
jgi:hypothetical protein